MASVLKHLRSSTADKRPTASGLADGQLAINTASGTPGLYFEDSAGNIVKVGPAHVGTAAPNASPAGSTGNSKGELWVDENTTTPGLKYYNGSSFVNLTPSGTQTTVGLVELATDAETQAGTDTVRAVTPSGLQSKISDSTSTISSITIASATAVKSAYDLANAALPKTGGTVTGAVVISPSGSLSFEGATDNDFETLLSPVDPTADRTFFIPNITGTGITTSDTGTVTNGMLAGSIVDSKLSTISTADKVSLSALNIDGGTDIGAALADADLFIVDDGGAGTNRKAAATRITDYAFGKVSGDVTISSSGLATISELPVSKLQDGSARQLLQTDAAGTGVEWTSNVDVPGTLDVTSTATFDGVISASAGTALAPSVTFTGDVDTGIYQPSANNFAITTSGVERVNFTNTVAVFNDAGNNYDFRIEGDTNGSLFFLDASADAIGIGKSDPSVLLDIESVAASEILRLKSSNANGVQQTFVHGTSGYIGGIGSPKYWDATLSATDFGITSNANLDFLTSQVFRARITEAGNFGINDPAPDAKFTVSGVSSFGAGTAAAPGIAARGDLDTGIWFPAANTAAISTAGTERARIDSSGRVGIGTASPSDIVHIEGATSPTLRIRNSTTGSTASPASTFIDFRGFNQEIRARIEAQDRRSSVNGGFLNIGTADASNALVNALHIDSSQRVGIGTASPTAALTVNSTTTSNTTAALILGEPSFSNGRMLYMGYNTTDNTGFIQPVYWGVENKPLSLCPNGGNVGIGTATPGYKLDVNGAGSFIGAIRATSTGTCTILPAGVSASWTGSGFALQSEGSTAPIGFLQGSSERARIDSSGRLLVGTSSARSFAFGIVPTLQIESATASNGLAITTNRNDASSNILSFGKSRSATLGGVGIVSADDTVGTIRFEAADGSALIQAAQIAAQVDGAPGVNDMPGRLVFSTTADGASSPTERLRISNNGTIFCGNGETAASPTSRTIAGTGGSGTDITGATLTIQGGRGTGAAAGGPIVFSTAAAGALPGTILNAAAEVARVTPDKYLRMAASTGGIQFGGDTAAANALDDYEEGTFTPTIVGTTAAGTGTYSIQVGRYTKIGNRVYYNLYVVWSAHTGTGNIRVAGLPFTSNNTTNNISPASVFTSQLALAADNLLTAYAGVNSTQVVLTQYPTGGGTTAEVAMDTAANLALAGHYEV